MPEMLTTVHTTDEHGRLFQEGGELRRAISTDVLACFRELHRSDQLGAIVDAGLVPTQIRDAGTDGDAYLVHQRVPFITYPQEWTGPMLQEAALTTLRLARRLHGAGMHLHDPHAGNIAFAKSVPLFIDASSIRPGSVVGESFVCDFLASFVYPLERFRHAGGRTPAYKAVLGLAALLGAEAIVADVPAPGPAGQHDPLRLVRRTSRGRHLLRAARRGGSDPKAGLRLLDQLESMVRDAQLKVHQAEWSAYGGAEGAGGPVGSVSGPGGGTKGRAVAGWLEQFPAGRLVDMACSHGWFSEMAARAGHTTLGVELDQVALEGARLRGRSVGFDTAWMDVLNPTPPMGRALCLPDAHERFACDTMLMLALLHHLVLKQNVSFASLAAMVDRYAPKRLVIEWIPATDPYVARWPAELGVSIPDWYREERFVQAFSAHFPRHQRVNSGIDNAEHKIDGVRMMYLFER